MAYRNYKAEDPLDLQLEQERGLRETLGTLGDLVHRIDNTKGFSLRDVRRELVGLFEPMRTYVSIANTNYSHLLNNPVTGIPGMRALNKAMGDYQERRETDQMKDCSIYVCRGDIDNFKQLNDSIGNNKANEVLKVFYSTFFDELREGDFMHPHGDEAFAMIATPSTRVAFDVLTRCKDAAVNAVKRKLGYDITISFGMAKLRENESPHDADERAMKNKDLAKEAGKNLVVGV